MFDKVFEGSGEGGGPVNEGRSFSAPRLDTDCTHSLVGVGYCFTSW